MSSYDVSVPDVGTVKVQKKRGMKSIRLRVTARGELVVSAPWYVSRPMIQNFLTERKEWMQMHSQKRRTIYYDGMHFGRNMQLAIFPKSVRRRSKMLADTLEIYLDSEYDPESKTQQRFIEQKMIRTLQLEAENTLLPRLHEVSRASGIDFNQAYIKNLIGRWGSCDQSKNITLSLFLVQLPDPLIDYVITHELAHTHHMNHSAAFWEEVTKNCPNYKVLRKNLKEHEPRVIERL